MAEMGELLDIPQTTYSNYEHGVREIPNKCLGKLIQFGVDSAWIISGSIAKDRCLSIVKHMQLNSWSSSNVAEKMNIPKAFVEAVMEFEVSPSFEFADRFYSTFKLPNPEKQKPAEPSNHDPDIVDNLRLENARLQGNLDSTMRHAEYLENLVDELLKKTGGK